MTIETRHVETARHRTSYEETGPADGPLMFFLHGWPELGIIWRPQLEYFARAGYRCIAPDMRGYGGSSVPYETSAYAVRELVADMTELHDALGGAPAIWVGHDWGSPVTWGVAAHHAERCRGVASLCVPYQPHGFALPTLIPLVDRKIYPEAEYPVGQWDYFLWYRENFELASKDFEANVAGTLSFMFRSGSPAVVGKPAKTGRTRAKGGWFGAERGARPMRREEALMSNADFDRFVAAFERTGFRGADAWYVNDDANIAFADAAPNGGHLDMPVLFLHAAWDQTCETVNSRLAEPMRASCTNLSESKVDAGHQLMIECPDEVNRLILEWMRAQGMGPVSDG